MRSSQRMDRTCVANQRNSDPFSFFPRDFSAAPWILAALRHQFLCFRLFSTLRDAGELEEMGGLF